MKRTDPGKPENAQDSVYASLRNSILNLNLLPGTAVSEKEISLRYQVSRTPVREAFIHLSKEGLIKVIPQKETQVSRIDFNRVKQELFLRETLESGVLGLFIENAASAHFTELEELMELQSKAGDNKDYIKFLQYDNDFHRIFFEVAGQELAWEVQENMGGHYHRVRLLSTWLNEITKSIVSQHKSIFSALKRKDLQKARPLLESHLHKLDIEEAMLKETFPDYFSGAAEERKYFDVDFGGLNFNN
jgi:DNA-binding GntR family transcriptional regulator